MDGSNKVELCPDRWKPVTARMISSGQNGWRAKRPSIIFSIRSLGGVGWPFSRIGANVELDNETCHGICVGFSGTHG